MSLVTTACEKQTIRQTRRFIIDFTTGLILHLYVADRDLL